MGELTASFSEWIMQLGIRWEYQKDKLLTYHCDQWGWLIHHDSIPNVWQCINILTVGRNAVVLKQRDVLFVVSHRYFIGARCAVVMTRGVLSDDFKCVHVVPAVFDEVVRALAHEVVAFVIERLVVWVTSSPAHSFNQSSSSMLNEQENVYYFI